MIDNTINDAKTIVDGGVGKLLAGRYHILRQLGEGGMGSVWLAEDRQLDNRKVAIKMLPTIVVKDKRAYQQLKSEALVSLKLVHPNIVTLRAFEENSGAPFLVMDYIEGQTLSDYLAVKGKLSEKETVALLKPIAAALDYAHSEKVIHRDVKPSNIIIRKDGHPFILDFGIAREIQESMTRVTGRTISGTLLYMSPEQLRGAPPAPAQDVYSFAAMAYECLKGEPPFARGEIAHQILNEKPLPLFGGLHFVASIMVGLSKRPESRPRSCSAVLGLEDLSRKHLSGELTKVDGRRNWWAKKLLLFLVVALSVVVIALLCQNILEHSANENDEALMALEMPERRTSLSEIEWRFFVDEYYKHSIEERQKEHQKQGKAGLNMPDWAATHIGGGLFLKEVEKDSFESDASATKVFSEINDAFKKKDYTLAAKLLGDFSCADYTVCQFFNGVLAECRHDIKAAHRGYQLAAEEWCKEALFNLGVLYEFGVGVQRDTKLAAGYYQRSAIQGDKEALQRWQRLSDSNVTVPDFNLVPIFDRKPWPDSSVLVTGTEFAALRDDVGRWWDVPFSKVKDFFKVNANQVDGKFFFTCSTNNVWSSHKEMERGWLKNIGEGYVPAVEKWNGEKMQFVKANDAQAARNVALNYILSTGEAKFNLLGPNIKHEDILTDKVLRSDDGMYELLTDTLLDYLISKMQGK